MWIRPSTKSSPNSKSKEVTSARNGRIRAAKRGRKCHPTCFLCARVATLRLKFSARPACCGSHQNRSRSRALLAASPRSLSGLSSAAYFIGLSLGEDAYDFAGSSAKLFGLRSGFRARPENENRPHMTYSFFQKAYRVTLVGNDRDSYFAGSYCWRVDYCR